MTWPGDPGELRDVQRTLGAALPSPWHPEPLWQEPAGRAPRIGGCFACFPRGLTGTGHAGDPVWVAAVVMTGRTVASSCVRENQTLAAYTPGLLALREGPALAKAVRELDPAPDVLLVNATGRDHPRRAGLALHLGAVLGVPTVGVTHRPLLASGAWPPDDYGSASPLALEGQIVGYWLRTRAGTRPLAVDAGWRTTAEQAVHIVLAATVRHRTPEPLRRARHLARRVRVRRQHEEQAALAARRQGYPSQQGEST